eukprot:Partr_v1_DN25856_c0_g1_i1_m2912 putative Uroporphyrinogen decarboxylase
MKDFPPLTNDRLLRAIKGEPLDKTPVWIMRQAGRYLPEFRQVRSQHDFFTICQTPSLACQVTLQPIHRFSPLFDASIIFSDILVVPQALGLEVQMIPSKGPHFPAPLLSPEDMDRRLNVDVDVSITLKYVYEAIELTRKSLKGACPLYGFSGAPWTLMAYMIEGGGSKTFAKAKRWLVVHPAASRRLLSILTRVIVEYFVCQIEAGAQVLQLFDSWAGELTPEHFRAFALPAIRDIASGVRRRCAEVGVECVPMTIFAKGAHYALADLVSSGFEVIGVDWCADIVDVKRQVRQAMRAAGVKRVCLQGNMDPVFLLASDPAVIRTESERIIRAFLLDEAGKLETEIGYICNLGHGITPEVDPEMARVFLESVDSVSRELLLTKK